MLSKVGRLDGTAESAEGLTRDEQAMTLVNVAGAAPAALAPLRGRSPESVGEALSRGGARVIASVGVLPGTLARRHALEDHPDALADNFLGDPHVVGNFPDKS